MPHTHNVACDITRNFARNIARDIARNAAHNLRDLFGEIGRQAFPGEDGSPPLHDRYNQLIKQSLMWSGKAGRQSCN